MAAVALTATNVRPVYPLQARIRSRIASVAITQGQALSLVAATGKVQLCDANAAGLQQFCGIALNDAGAGQAVDVLEEGEVAGYTLTGNYGTIIYASDTAGGLDTAVGTMTVNIGKVVGMSDPDLTKVLMVSVDWLRAWA